MIFASRSHLTQELLHLVMLSDWGCGIDDRSSTSGGCVFFGANTMAWYSKKQVVVSRSAMKVECWSLAHVVAEIAWVWSLMSELGLSHTQRPVVYCDNQSEVLLIANPILHAMTKHVVLHIHFVWEKGVEKQHIVPHMSSVRVEDCR